MLRTRLEDMLDAMSMIFSGGPQNGGWLLGWTVAYACTVSLGNFAGKVEQPGFLSCLKLVPTISDLTPAPSNPGDDRAVRHHPGSARPSPDIPGTDLLPLAVIK